MKKAIILGGTHDHIRLIEILKEKGYYTFLIDYLENPPARKFADEHIRESTLDMELVASLAKEIKPDLLIEACIDQALLTMAYVCEKLSLPCHISYQTALELTNKALMKSKFAEHHIPTTHYVILKSLGFESVAGLKYPLVVKPVDSNSSKGITKVNTYSDLESAAMIAFSHSRTKEIIVEEYMEGEEFSVDVAVENGEPTILLVTKNIKMQQNENTFTITQSYFPATTDEALLLKVHNIVLKIVLAYNIQSSPLLVQLIHNKGEISVIEFSARLGGGSKHHLIKKITGFDALEWFVDVVLTQPKSVTIQQMFRYACINYIYAKKGIIVGFEGFDELLNEGIIDDYYLYKTGGMEITNHIASTDRPAGILIADDDYAAFCRKQEIAFKAISILDECGTSMLINPSLEN
jgi:biotin carboxylase